ncbi:hypothetical protein BC938DRAFT_481308 [Jimgerdemannia flammicorona]|uniref:Uncharacterized protein n=1 Tax=Jimgerdemannia flammicorona TaxID=994334 RepID=A0A433QWX2_9FUNG|nr:hypothetical protein BC938DRAFT_481308 [Jimgerdemannia flammicorona]
MSGKTRTGSSAGSLTKKMTVNWPKNGKRVVKTPLVRCTYTDQDLVMVALLEGLSMAALLEEGSSEQLIVVLNY